MTKFFCTHTHTHTNITLSVCLPLSYKGAVVATAAAAAVAQSLRRDGMGGSNCYCKYELIDRLGYTVHYTSTVHHGAALIQTFFKLILFSPSQCLCASVSRKCTRNNLKQSRAIEDRLEGCYSLVSLRLLFPSIYHILYDILYRSSVITDCMEIIIIIQKKGALQHLRS